MNDLERSALLWLRVFALNPTRKINAEMVELYGVSRRRSRDIIRYLKNAGAIILKTSIGYGSKYVLDESVTKRLLHELDNEGRKQKTSGW